MKKSKTIIVPILALILFAGCSKWNMTESVGTDTSHPWDRAPQLWEDYWANLRAYKQRKHSLVYVRFDNGAEKPESEKNFMRCLPDSLDIVSLTNAEHFSTYDAEDMQWMRKVGTKVLYQVDLSKKIDFVNAIKIVKDNSLDGFSIAGVIKANREKLPGAMSKLHGNGLLVLEGYPNMLTEEELSKIDLFVLPSESVENSYALNNLIQDALEYGLSRDKILLAASFKGSWYDKSNTEKPVIPSMVENVTTFGPLAGLALYDIMSDYYHYDGNWLSLRTTISRLNP